MTLDLKVVNTDETIDFLAYISVNPIGHMLTWEFYKKNSKIIHNRCDIVNISGINLK